MPEPRVDEHAFRKLVEDMVALAAPLAPTVGSVDELVGMLSLALENDGQLRLLLKVATAGQQRR